LIRDLRAQLIELQTTAHAVNEQLVLGGIEKLIVELENLPALEH
jgi:hypothetical protein